jgi:hypothetical protein
VGSSGSAIAIGDLEGREVQGCEMRPMRIQELSPIIGGRTLRSPVKIYRTGKLVMGRLVELRMEHAQVLLLERTMSVTQNAGVVEIASFSYVSKAFRAATAMTPSDYRKSGGQLYS